MQFRDLAVRQVFEFDHSDLAPHLRTMAKGPWVKTGVRSYSRVSDGMACRVGTTRVAVVLVEDVIETQGSGLDPAACNCGNAACMATPGHCGAYRSR